MTTQTSDIAQLIEAMAKQHEAMVKQQQELIKALTLTTSKKPETEDKPPDEGTIVHERALKKLEPFHYDPTADSYFNGWIDRFQPVFSQDAASLNN